MWVLAAGATGTLTRSDSDEWHSDSWWSEGALDIGASGGDAVGLYFRKYGTGTYGVYECTHLENSCETEVNPDHRQIRFALGTSLLNQFADCGFLHVEPLASMYAGKTGTAYGQIATVGDGDVSAGEGCFTGIHLHQTANGIHNWEDPNVPQSASGGNTEYWYWNSP